MKILLTLISKKRGALTGPAADLIQEYVERSARYVPCECRVFPSEEKLLAFVEELAARTRPALVLGDSRGDQLDSPGFASRIGKFKDGGLQTMIFGVGPADGWSGAALKRADLTVAFGRITLPHELAAVVAAEQIYRGLTILAGHPYHSGH